MACHAFAASYAGRHGMKPLSAYFRTLPSEVESQVHEDRKNMRDASVSANVRDASACQPCIVS